MSEANDVPENNASSVPPGPEGDRSDVNWIEFAGRKRHPSNEYAWPQDEEPHLFAKPKAGRADKNNSPGTDESPVEADPNTAKTGEKQAQSLPPREPDEVVMPILTKALPATDRALTDTEEVRAAERARLLMAGLEKQYLKADNKYHFRDEKSGVAFEALEKRMTTKHEDPAVITSMIDLAEARGWTSLKLNGTKEFKREAWLQASARGIEVAGYEPDQLDQAKLAELKAEKSGPSNIIIDGSALQDRRATGRPERASPPLGYETEPKITLSHQQDQAVTVLAKMMADRGDSPEAIARAREIAAETFRTDRVHVGKLLESGVAPFNNDKREKDSPFVVLVDDKGKQTTVWGVDLPRALEASDAQVGEKIALAFRGRRDVTVDVPIKDDAGAVIGSEPKVVNRNAWEVVQFDKLREDAKAKVVEAAQRVDNPAKIKVFDHEAAAPPAPPIQSRERERQR